ncbi:PREDICTED: uncharacterized protein LOC107104760 [Cyprinodon variegatus]|uniref:uncharacterized protein LOC107104760 n=1 Tax=Cyprinodon variegatus TaxID=28743 RepID=UPI000742A680|nr:PREDICTED: uncharacterized protein LOC107104760 [Cyprinodon variegatus]
MESTQSRLPCRGFCSYFAVFVIFVYLGVNFNCSCTPQGWNCKLFLVLPLLITFVFLLWTDSSFQTTSRHLLLSSDWSFLTFSCRYIIRAAFVALLWVVCVLINGEWYVCCMSNQTTQAPLACKSAGMITEEEQKTIAELKNTSWMIGTGLLCGIISVPALFAMLGWSKQSARERKKFYHKLILQQNQSVLKETLGNYAREKLSNEMKRRIEDGRWEECWDVAPMLIKESAGSVAP